MNIEKWVNIPIGQIDRNDDTFRITFETHIDRLLNAIRETGVLQPILVQQRSQVCYRIISGFRRFAAVQALDMSQIPCAIAGQGVTDLQLFRTMLIENLTVRELNAVEITGVIYKLKSCFELSQKEIISDYFPLLNLGRNEKVYNLYAAVHHLPDEAKRAVLDETITLEVAYNLSTMPRAEIMTFISLSKALRLGKNRQREFLLLIKDSARILDISPADFLEDTRFRTIFKDTNLTPGQKSERFKKTLFSIRYPQYSKIQSEFEQLLLQAKLPPDLQIRPSRNFQGEEFFTHFVFKDVKGFKEKLEILYLLYEKGIVKKLIDLT